MDIGVFDLFIVEDGETEDATASHRAPAPLPFASADELPRIGHERGLRIPGL